MIPVPFIPVEAGLPSDNKPVLIIRRSSVRSSYFEVLTGRYDPEFRPLNPWVDLNNDAITDSGREVLGWQISDWLNWRQS